MNGVLDSRPRHVRTATLALLVAAFLALPERSVAQEMFPCEGPNCVSGTVVIMDGSTPPDTETNKTCVEFTSDPGLPNQHPLGLGWPNGTSQVGFGTLRDEQDQPIPTSFRVKARGTVCDNTHYGTWQRIAYSHYYESTAWGAGPACNADGCSGSFNLELYASWGNVKGRLYDLRGDPVGPNFVVAAY